VTIGALLTMGLGVLFGVWIGRSNWADRILRPILDAAQVMPPFVYLVPCLALFGPTRFTAIVAAIVYAAPVVIKVVGEGIRGVPANSIEAAMAAGSNSWQQIVKVQLPMWSSAAWSAAAASAMPLWRASRRPGSPVSASPPASPSWRWAS